MGYAGHQYAQQSIRNSLQGIDDLTRSLAALSRSLEALLKSLSGIGSFNLPGFNSYGGSAYSGSGYGSSSGYGSGSGGSGPGSGGSPAPNLAAINAKMHAASQAAVAKTGAQNLANQSSGGTGGGGLPPVKTGFSSPDDDDDESIGDQIANNDHSFDDHTGRNSDFPWIKNRPGMADMINKVIDNGFSRQLARGRTGYLHDDTIVISNPAWGTNLGSAFRPSNAWNYFWNIME